MGKLFSLDAGTKSVVQDALDDLIEEFGKDCRIVYPPRAERCANCNWDAGRGASAGTWRTGGPIPFGRGLACPSCGGSGLRFTEETETVKLSCAWSPKDFFHPLKEIPGLDLRSPHAVVQTKGYLKDAPRLLRCEYIVFQTGIEAVVRKKFKLLGQPGDASNIIQGRYFVATWAQTG